MISIAQPCVLSPMAGHSLNGAVVDGDVGGVHVEAPADVLRRGTEIAAIAKTATAEAATRVARGRLFIFFAFVSPNSAATAAPIDRVPTNRLFIFFASPSV